MGDRGTPQGGRRRQQLRQLLQLPHTQCCSAATDTATPRHRRLSNASLIHADTGAGTFLLLPLLLPGASWQWRSDTAAVVTWHRAEVVGGRRQLQRQGKSVKTTGSDSCRQAESVAAASSSSGQQARGCRHRRSAAAAVLSYLPASSHSFRPSSQPRPAGGATLSHACKRPDSCRNAQVQRCCRCGSGGLVWCFCVWVVCFAPTTCVMPAVAAAGCQLALPPSRLAPSAPSDSHAHLPSPLRNNYKRATQLKTTHPFSLLTYICSTPKFALSCPSRRHSQLFAMAVKCHHAAGVCIKPPPSLSSWQLEGEEGGRAGKQHAQATQNISNSTVDTRVCTRNATGVLGRCGSALLLPRSLWR